jgi:hypothetical protein
VRLWTSVAGSRRTRAHRVRAPRAMCGVCCRAAACDVAQPATSAIHQETGGERSHSRLSSSSHVSLSPLARLGWIASGLAHHAELVERWTLLPYRRGRTHSGRTTLPRGETRLLDGPQISAFRITCTIRPSQWWTTGYASHSNTAVGALCGALLLPLRTSVRLHQTRCMMTDDMHDYTGDGTGTHET